MKHPLRLLFLAGSFLLFSQASPAQNFVTSAPASSSSSGGMIGNGSGPIDANFYSSDNASSNNFYYWNTGPDTSLGISPISSSDIGSSGSSAGMSASGAAPSAVYGFAQGDANFVPSTYVSYKKALAMGKQPQQQPDSSSNASLGDVARAYRAASKKNPEAKQKIPTVTQDNSGKIVVCKSDSGKCS